VVSRHNADIADTLYLGDVAMATTFWLSMGYNFGCMTASDTLFDSRDRGFLGSSCPMKTYRFPGSKGRCHGNHFLAFYIWGAHWLHLANMTEPSMCGGDAALMSNYFDHLFDNGTVIISAVNRAKCILWTAWVAGCD